MKSLLILLILTLRRGYLIIATTETTKKEGENYKSSFEGCGMMQGQGQQACWGCGGWGLLFGEWPAESSLRMTLFDQGSVQQMSHPWERGGVGRAGVGHGMQKFGRDPWTLNTSQKHLGYLPSFGQSGEIWLEVPEERHPQNNWGYQRETLNG